MRSLDIWPEIVRNHPIDGNCERKEIINMIVYFSFELQDTLCICLAFCVMGYIMGWRMFMIIVGIVYCQQGRRFDFERHALDELAS